MGKPTRSQADAELRKNIQAYKEMEANLEENHHGKTALFHNGELVQLFDDLDDAYNTGAEDYGMGCFTIHKIGEIPVSFGAMTPFIKTIDLAA